MSNIVGSAVVELRAEIARYASDMGRAARVAEQTSQRMKAAADTAKQAFVGLGTALVGGITVSALAESTRQTVASLAELDAMAQKTGASVERLGQIQQAATAFGEGMANIDVALTMLARGMATADQASSKAGRALDAIGVSATDASGKLRDPAEVLRDVAKHLRGYEDGAAKAALATDLLGRNGANMLPFLNNLAATVDDFATVSQEAAAQAVRFQDSLGMLSARSQALRQSIAVQVLPAANAFISAMTESATASDGVRGSVDELAADGSLRAWAEDAARFAAFVVDAFDGVQRVVRIVGKTIGAAAAQAVALAKGEFAQVRAIGNEFLADVDGILAAPQFSSRLERQLKAARESASSASPRPQLEYSGGAEAAARAVKAQTDNYQRLVEAIQDKLRISELEAQQEGKVTEAQKLSVRFAADIASGKIKATEAQQAYVQSLLLELNAAEKLRASNEALTRLRERQAEVMANLSRYGDDRARQADREFASAALGDDAREFARTLARVEDDFRRQRERFTKDAGDLIGTAEFEAGMAQIDAAMQAQLERERGYHQQRLAMQADWSNGAARALANYAEAAANVAGQVEGVMSRAFSGMEDALAQFVSTGKLRFRDLAVSIIADIARMQARAAISGVLNMITGAVGGAIAAGASTAFNGAVSGVSGAFGGPQTTGVFLPGRAVGGPVTGGSAYLVGERGPEIYVPGTSGTIVPNHLLRSVDTGAGAVTVQVVVNAETGQSSTSGDAGQLRQLGKLIGGKVREIILQEKRQGGLLAAG